MEVVDSSTSLAYLITSTRHDLCQLELRWLFSILYHQYLCRNTSIMTPSPPGCHWLICKKVICASLAGCTVYTVSQSLPLRKVLEQAPQMFNFVALSFGHGLPVTVAEDISGS